jgi:hypothetical protein
VKRLLRSAAPLLSFLLLLQVVLAPLHCLAMAAAGSGGFETIICSPDGMRVIQVEPDGHGEPAGDGAACFICADTARVVLPEPLLPAGRVAQPSGRAWHPAAIAILLPPARAPPYAPRGPPLHA